MAKPENSKQLTARGARLMDKLLPGWYKRVNLETLEMSDGAMCLLGQTFGVHAEQCLAKELYPKEWKEALAIAQSRLSLTGMKRYGYVIAANHGNMLKTLMQKKNIKQDSDLLALREVCAGHDTKCYWAEEIAERLAKDA